jgi:putative ABC transport system permease protein
MYPEMAVPDDEKRAFFQTKDGAIIGRRLLDVFGWRVGQNVTLQGTIYPGDWTFKIVGTYAPTSSVLNDDMMIFRHDYLEERIGRPGQAGWYVMRIDQPDHAANIARIIDDQFRNSRDATKTGTEQAFNASFATMWGNVGLLMDTIGMAVVFAILLVTANAMMMGFRERVREVAVLKTIGFADTTLFTLVMLESAVVVATGALLGLGGAKLLYQASNFNAAGFLPGFNVTGRTLLLGVVIAVLLTAASGLAPAIRTARLPVVRALRHVE